MGWHGRSYHKSCKLIIAHYKQRLRWATRQTVAKQRIMADSWPSSSYCYKDMGSFCHRVFKQNVILAITLSFLASLSLPYKVQWQIVSLCMPLGSYVPVLIFFSFSFPTYFTLCLTAARITLNCALCSTVRRSLSVIFGAWMCPWGVVSWRQTYSFCFCPSALTVLERKPLFSCGTVAIFGSIWTIPVFRTKIYTVCRNIVDPKHILLIFFVCILGRLAENVCSWI